MTRKTGNKTSSGSAVNHVSPMRDPEYAEREKKYRARDALSTLTRAEEIRRDRSLMKDVKAEARQQAKALSSVTGKPSRSK